MLLNLSSHDLALRHYLSTLSQTGIYNSQLCKIYIFRDTRICYMYFFRVNLLRQFRINAMYIANKIFFKLTMKGEEREKERGTWHIAHTINEILGYQKVGGPQVFQQILRARRKYLVIFDTLLQYLRTTRCRELHKNVWRVTRIAQKPTCRAVGVPEHSRSFKLRHWQLGLKCYSLLKKNLHYISIDIDSVKLILLKNR